MKKLLCVALLAGVACPAMAGDTKPALTAASWAGVYEVHLSNGVVRISHMKPDGSFADTLDGKEVDTGYWSVADGKVCFDHRGPDGSVKRSGCYRPSAPAADGTFTATPEAGPTVTLKRIG